MSGKCINYVCCVLLSKLYLCRRIYSTDNRNRKPNHVVYCFQNCIFVEEFTAHIIQRRGFGKLCIAFKIVSL